MRKIQMDGDVYYSTKVDDSLAIDAFVWCKRQFGPHKSRWAMVGTRDFVFEQETDYLMFELKFG
jgi:hypothetical protein